MFENVGWAEHNGDRFIKSSIQHLLMLHMDCRCFMIWIKSPQADSGSLTNNTESFDLRGYPSQY